VSEPGAFPNVRDAATVILLRSADAGGFEVLLVQRHARSGFMAGAYVFPGGKMEPGETAEVAGARELAEESGVRVDPAALVPWGHWITPSSEPVRFSARFFVAVLPDGEAAASGSHEITDLRWMTPADALAAQARGALNLPPPTLRSVEHLATYASVEAVLAAGRGRRGVMSPILPKLTFAGQTAIIVLPWDPGYDATPGEGLPVPADHPLRILPSRLELHEGRWWNR
jgi:8-oxo-dGTP pyrophosphatase MutT (NUDIX family)